jgi:acyl carrier protein
MMTREQVFSLIRSHLADELELDPDRISESTRFKEDLVADSLDLYTLVQELEDSYGVKISDEEASKILTVGQTVDFVLASSAGAAVGGAPAEREQRP